MDRTCWVALCRLWPDWQNALLIVKPETAIRWRRKGFEVAEATVSRHMPRRRKPPSHSWRTFLQNHTKDLVSIDFFVVPTATFRFLYVFLVLEHERRRIVDFNVSEGPSARWTGQQLANAFAYDSARKYLKYYHGSRTHLALGKDAPEPRNREFIDGGKVIALPMVSGLHHRYTRRAA